MSIIDGRTQLPIGLGMKLALDLKAMANFANLPDEKKKELISYIESSTTGDEAKNRVEEVVSNLRENSFF